MKQNEMAKYLKLITVTAGILFLVFIGWFLPATIKEEFIRNNTDNTTFYIVMISIWITAVPCYIALMEFYKICCRIGNDNSFCAENAVGLKRMSVCMLIDSFAYIIFILIFFITGMNRIYQLTGMVLFIVIMICIILTVICAALSHLVEKASHLQEEHDLTV